MKQVAAIALGAATVLAGCTTAGSYDAWLGEPSDELIANWGPPVRSAQLDDGRETMVYWGGDCRFTVFANAAGRISEIRTDLNECIGVTDLPEAPPSG